MFVLGELGNTSRQPNSRNRLARRGSGRSGCVVKGKAGSLGNCAVGEG